MKNFLVIAHRGFSSKYPENSLQSFEEALRLNVDALECDVILTKDERAIVYHDIELGNRHSSELTYAEICAHTCSKVPLLEDLLALVVSTEVFLIIDIKYHGLTLTQRTRFLEIILKLAESNNVSERIILNSSDHYLLFRAKVKLPYIKTIAVTWPTSYHQVNNFYWPEQRLEVPAAYYGKLIEADYISVPYKEVTAELVRMSHLLGIGVLPYTVNEQKFLEALLDIGVDGIFTDRPDILKQILVIKQKHRNSGQMAQPSYLWEPS